MEPEIIELSMNRTRRKFLRLLLSSLFISDRQLRNHAITDQGSREAVMTLSDEQLLREWSWLHAMWTCPSSSQHRIEEFQKRLKECARMMAVEAILYSDEELRVLRNTSNAQKTESSHEENVRADAELKAATERRRAAAKANANATETLRIATEACEKEKAARTTPKHDTEINQRLGGGVSSASEHAPATAAGCGAQGPVPPSDSPEARTPGDTGSAKRRRPTREPTVYPTTTPTDGDTTDDNLSETDENRLKRILNIPGISRRIDEMWFGDEEADDESGEMGDVSWVYHQLDTLLFRRT
jgi:hypothetical protein